MTTQHIPVLLIAIPLLVAFVIPIINRFGGTGKALRDIVALIAVLLNSAMAFVLGFRVFGTGPATYVLGGEKTAITMPSGNMVPIRILLNVDAFGALIAISCSVVAVAAMIYSLRFMKKQERLGKYYALAMLVLASINGMLLTGDLFNLFVFLEILSLSSAGLIAFWRDDDEAPEAAFKYILISTVASLFVLFAVGMFYGQYGVLNIAKLATVISYGLLDKVALCLLIAGFAMKCGAAPLHMWVPDAYGRSLAAVTALFVVISQVSLYALIKIVFVLFGITLNLDAVGWIMISLGVVSMVVGIFMALPQKDIKRLMAYQSVSQTGYMLLGIGVGLVVLADPEALAGFGIGAINGGIFHIVNHAIYKSLLFLAAGAIFYRLGTRNLDEMGGLASRMPWTTVLFAIGALAIAGVPPFNGFSSKLMIYISVFKFSPILSIIAIVVSVLTLALFMKVIYVGFLRPAKHSKKDVKEVPALMLVAMVLLGVLVVVIGLFPGLFVDNFIQPATQALIDQAGYVGAVIP
jgi:multicomponent Na+:H+ antiporter subunit D